MPSNSSPVSSYAALKKFSHNQGIALFGVTEIHGLDCRAVLSERTLTSMPRAVCLGVALSNGILNEIVEEPTRLYFHHYRTVNMFLDQAALKVAGYIQGKGFLALPVPASQIVDWQKQTAHLSHKHVAAAAGLGWIGRNNLLVNARHGSRVRLATILTDMPLKIDRRAATDCGTCRACVTACPAQAIGDRPEDFDHARCFEKLKEFQKRKLVDQYVCGVCVRACPGKRRNV